MNSISLIVTGLFMLFASSYGEFSSLWFLRKSCISIEVEFMDIELFVVFLYFF